MKIHIFALIVLFVSASICYGDRGNHISPIPIEIQQYPSVSNAATQLNDRRTAAQNELIARLVNILENYGQRLAIIRSKAASLGDLTQVEMIDNRSLETESTIKHLKNGNISRHLLDYLGTHGRASTDFANACKSLRDQVDRAMSAYFASEHDTLAGYIADINKAIVLLIQENSLSQARILEAEKNTRIQELKKLEELKFSSGWKVIFRSADPVIWNTDTRDNPDHFATTIAREPFKGYIRIKRIDNDDMKIIYVDVDTLISETVSGQYIWNGNGNIQTQRKPDDSVLNCRLLGIADTKLRLSYRSPLNAVVDLPGRGNGYGGWGFARRSLLYSDQQYAWGEEPISNPIAIEIAIKETTLALSEKKNLLNQEQKLIPDIADKKPNEDSVVRIAEQSNPTSAPSESKFVPKYQYRYQVRLIKTSGSGYFTIYSSDGTTYDGKFKYSEYDNKNLNFQGFFRNDSTQPCSFQFEIALAKQVKQIGFQTKRRPMILGRSFHKTAVLQPGEVEEFQKVIPVSNPLEVNIAEIGNVKVYPAI